jgi:hypothetical protein
MTDCRPVSLFSIQTGRQLGDEIGTTIDKRRFTANIYMDLASAGGARRLALQDDGREPTPERGHVAGLCS